MPLRRLSPLDANQPSGDVDPLLDWRKSASGIDGVVRRSLLEANLDAVAIIGPHGHVQEVNPALETISGRTRNELIGTDAALYLTDAGAARRLYRDAIREGSVRDRPLEIRHRDGHITHVLCNASAYRDGDGNTLGVVAAARPISAAAVEVASAAPDRSLRRAARLVVVGVSSSSMALGAAGLAVASPNFAGVASLLELPAPRVAASFTVAGLACALLGSEVPSERRRLRDMAARMLGVGAVVCAGVELAGSRDVSGPSDPWSAAALLLLGAALVGIDWTVTRRSHRYWPAHALAFTAGMLSIAGLLDAMLASRTPLTSMPPSSAFGALGLALGIVCSRPDYSLGALLTSPTLGGMLTRWLWPAAVVVPVLLGMTARHVASAGLVPRE